MSHTEVIVNVFINLIFSCLQGAILKPGTMYWFRGDLRMKWVHGVDHLLPFPVPLDFQKEQKGARRVAIVFRYGKVKDADLLVWHNQWKWSYEETGLEYLEVQFPFFVFCFECCCIFTENKIKDCPHRHQEEGKEEEQVAANSGGGEQEVPCGCDGWPTPRSQMESWQHHQSVSNFK